MNNLAYWLKQDPKKTLFPDIEWNKPEQKNRAGKIGIVGGNKLSFVGIVNSYQVASDSGAGQIRVLMPDALKKDVSTAIDDVVFASSNHSGGLSREALDEVKALANWADGILLVGDAGRNSETAMLYENFVRDYKGALTITRDSIDLLLNAPESMVERDDTLLVASFAQLQKIFTKVYYPKILTFSMQLQQLVEAMHKFTITYPVTIATLHQDQIVIASGGKVTTTPWQNPMAIWKGSVATSMAVYQLWNPKQTLESATTSLITK